MWSLLAFKCHTIYTAEEQQESCCALNSMHKTHLPIVTNVDFWKIRQLDSRICILSIAIRYNIIYLHQSFECNEYCIFHYIGFQIFFHFSYLWKKLVWGFGMGNFRFLYCYFPLLISKRPDINNRFILRLYDSVNNQTTFFHYCWWLHIFKKRNAHFNIIGNTRSFNIDFVQR